MANFNFADRYRAAGLSPGPDIIRLRQEPFDGIRGDVDTSAIVDLVRLYFELPTSNGADWFRDAFAQTDPSFSMVDNAREAAVLSACILEAAMEDGNDIAALATVSASVAGNRQSAVAAEVVELARDSLIKKAIAQRSNQIADPKEIKPPVKSKAPAAADALVQGPDWQKAADLIKQVSQEGNEATRTLTNQVSKVVAALAENTSDLREEVDMLWRHVGGWSRVLDKPFTELDMALAAALAGLDLADLSRTCAGPAAAQAILYRTISQGRKGKMTAVSIAEAVDSLENAEAEKLKLGEELKAFPDICPVLAAFQKAHEIGETPAWQKSFFKASGVEASTSLQPIDLAMQVYRERSLIAALS